MGTYRLMHVLLEHSTIRNCSKEFTISSLRKVQGSTLFYGWPGPHAQVSIVPDGGLQAEPVENFVSLGGRLVDEMASAV